MRDEIIAEAKSLINNSDIKSIINCLKKLKQLTIDLDTLNNTDFLLYTIAKNHRIIASFDVSRKPDNDEIILIYGNYPRIYENLVIHNPIKRHYSDFWTFQHDRIESDPRWQGVDQIYIINEGKRIDRYDLVLRELATARAPFERVVRTEAAKSDVGMTTQVRGLLGCLQSHIDVLKRALAAGYENIMVLEDDFCFTSDIEQHLNDLYEFNLRKYDYYVCLISTSKYGAIVEKDDLVSYSYQRVTNTGAYLISRAGMEKLLPVFENALINLAATGKLAFAPDISWRVLQPSGKFFVFRRKMGFQVASFSDIEKEIVRYLD